MKKLLILALALMIALPVLGLAAEVTTAPETTQTEAPDTAPLGGQRGRRWQAADPEATAPATGYVDADGDGVCDNCGNAPGTNPEAPGFADADGDGVCDNLGTAEQGRASRRVQAMQGRAFGQNRMMQGRGRNNRSFGRSQGMMGRMGRRGMMNRGAQQGPNYADEDQDGVCDHFGTQDAPSFGPGRRNFTPGQGFGPGSRDFTPGQGFGPGSNRR